MLASLKLLDLMADKSESMAKQWAKDVVKNPKTPYYHISDQDKIIPQAAEFYKKLSRAYTCLLYTSPSPRDRQKSRMPSSA